MYQNVDCVCVTGDDVCMTPLTVYQVHVMALCAVIGLHKMNNIPQNVSPDSGISLNRFALFKKMNAEKQHTHFINMFSFIVNT